MLIFPYRFDLSLNKLPYVTILLCLVCIFVYSHQHFNLQDYIKKTEKFCSVDRSSSDRMIMQKALGGSSPERCIEFMEELSISVEPDKLIEGYSKDSEKYAGLSTRDSVE